MAIVYVFYLIMIIFLFVWDKKRNFAIISNQNIVIELNKNL